MGCQGRSREYESTDLSGCSKHGQVQKGSRAGLVCDEMLFNNLISGECGCEVALKGGRAKRTSAAGTYLASRRELNWTLLQNYCTMYNEFPQSEDPPVRVVNNNVRSSTGVDFILGESI